MEEKLKIAVFIDFDNIEIGVKSTLQREFDVAAVLIVMRIMIKRIKQLDGSAQRFAVVAGAVIHAECVEGERV